MSLLTLKKIKDPAEKYLVYQKLYRYIDKLCLMTSISKSHLENLEFIRKEVKTYLEENFLNSLYNYLPNIMSELQSSSRNILISNKKILDVLLEGQRIEATTKGIRSMQEGVCGTSSSSFNPFNSTIYDVYYSKDNPFYYTFKQIASLIESVERSDNYTAPLVTFPEKSAIKAFLKSNIDKGVLQLVRYRENKKLYESSDDDFIESLTDKIYIIKQNLEKLTACLIILSNIKRACISYNGMILENTLPWLGVQGLVKYYHEIIKMINNFTILSDDNEGISIERYIYNQNAILRKVESDANKFDVQKKLLKNEFFLIKDIIKVVEDNVEKFKLLDKYRDTLCENNADLIRTFSNYLNFTNRLIIEDSNLISRNSDELSLTINNFIRGNILSVRPNDDISLPEKLLNVLYKIILDEIKSNLERYASPQNHNYTFDLKLQTFNINRSVNHGDHDKKAKFIMKVLLIIDSKADNVEKIINIKKLTNEALTEITSGQEIKVLLGEILNSISIIQRFANIIVPSRSISNKNLIEGRPRCIVEEVDDEEQEKVSHQLQISFPMEKEKKSESSIDNETCIPSAFDFIQFVLNNAILSGDVEFFEPISFLNINKDMYLQAHNEMVKYNEIKTRVEVLNLIKSKFEFLDQNKANKLSLIIYLQNILVEEYSEQMKNQFFRFVINFIESISNNDFCEFWGLVTGEKYRLQLVNNNLEEQNRQLSHFESVSASSNEELSRKLEEIIDTKIRQELNVLDKFIEFKKLLTKYSTGQLQSLSNSIESSIDIVGIVEHYYLHHSEGKDNSFIKRILDKKYYSENDLKNIEFNYFCLKVFFESQSSRVTLLTEVFRDYNNGDLSKEDINNAFISNIKGVYLSKLSVLVLPNIQRYNPELQMILDNNLYNVFNFLMKKKLHDDDKNKYISIVTALIHMGASIVNRVNGHEKRCIDLISIRKLDNLTLSDELNNPEGVINLLPAFDIMMSFFKQRALYYGELSIHPDLKDLFSDFIIQSQSFHNSLSKYLIHKKHNPSEDGTGFQVIRASILKKIFITMDSLFNEVNLKVVIENLKYLKTELEKYDKQLLDSSWGFLFIDSRYHWNSGVDSITRLIGTVDKLKGIVDFIDNKRSWFADHSTFRSRHYNDIMSKLEDEICAIAEPEIEMIPDEDLEKIKSELIPELLEKVMDTVSKELKITRKKISLLIDNALKEKPNYEQLKEYKPSINVLFCRELLKKLQGTNVKKHSDDVHSSNLSCKV